MNTRYLQLSETCSCYLFIAVNDGIFLIDLWAPRAPRGTHPVARNSSPATQKILSVHLRPSSQYIHQVVCPVCDPAVISAGPSQSLGLPQTGHIPTVSTRTVFLSTIITYNYRDNNKAYHISMLPFWHPLPMILETRPTSVDR